MDDKLRINSAGSGVACLEFIGGYRDADLGGSDFTYTPSTASGEPTLKQLGAMAEECGMRSKQIRVDWKKALELIDFHPFLCMKTSGGYFVVDGVGVREDGTEDMRVYDPFPDAEDFSPEAGLHRFWPREVFEAKCAGKGMLFQKKYALSDENQPFGLRWFIPEFLKLKGLFGQIIVAVIAMTLLSLIIPLFFQIVIDKVLHNNSFNTLNVLGIGVILAILFNAGLEYLRNYLLLFATAKIDINTAMKTFSHLMRLPVNFFDAVPSGLIIKHMQQTDQIRGFLSGNLFFTMLDLFSLVVFIPFLMLYSIPLTGVVLGFSLLMALVVMSLIKPFYRRLNTLYEAEGKRQSRLVESLHGIHTVKSLALEPNERKAWNDSSAFSIKSHFNVGKIALTANTISSMLEMMMNICVIWVGAHLVFNQTMTVGALIAFQMLSGRVSGPLVKLVALVQEYQQTALSVKMLGAVMNHPAEHAGGGARPPLEGAIQIEHVNFRYQPELPNALHDLSIDIRPREVLGIVGRSGSGKSTLARMVQAMYSPQSGIIRMDGIDIREIDKAHLRKNIGVVLQDNYFFQGTIRDNIRLTKPGALPDEIINAACQAGADEFVARLPKGYDTELEENASNLSGGQKQRLAIARALLSNPKILILDEATSALDPESELIVQKNLRTIAQGRTVLIISHRLSMVRNADRILVLNGGKMDALAPHDILAHRDGIYKEFWQQQTGRAQ